MGKFNHKVEIGGGNFLRIEPNTAVTGVFVGEIATFYCKWEDRRRVVCSPEQGGKFRFAANFIVKENGVFVAKILEGGAQIYKQVQEFENNGYSVDDTIFTIKRQGSGMETEYFVTPQRERISPEMQKQLKAVEIYEINGGDENGKALSSDDIPF